ncbi:MAG: hypothetical protein NZM04_06190 [Methylacidiphilales bacterium]|nr:hypothetical protein [Candidatus Methylacidiphilales bacterium]MDW8349158.1 hypothetical protein [Verrucomicrobiae bacterium]
MRNLNVVAVYRAAGVIGFCFVVSCIVGCAKKEASVAVPQLLPEYTLFFDWVPNQEQTWNRFKGSAAYKFYGHPDTVRVVTLAEEQLVAALKPTFEKYPAVQELYQLLKQTVFELYEADRGESFFALIRVLPATKDSIHLVGGIRPRPEDLPKLRRIVAAFEEYYKKHIVALPLVKKLEDFFEVSKDSHKGTMYRRVRLAIGEHEHSFCFAEAKGWYLYSVSESALKQFLDALAQANLRPKPSLADREEFRQYVNSASMPDRITFGNGEKGIIQLANFFENLWPKAVQGEPETESDEMREAFLRSIQSQKNIAGYSGTGVALTRIKEGGIEDLTYNHFLSDTAWKANRVLIPSRISLETLNMTRSDTLIYGAITLDVAEYFKMLKKFYEHDPVVKDGIEQLETKVTQDVNLDLYENILEPLGPEMAFALDWPDSSLYPLPSLWIQIKDSAAFQPAAEQLLKFLRETPTGMYAEKKETQHAEHTLLTYRIPMMVGLAPTLVIGPKGMGFFPDDTAARRYLGGGVPEIETLQSAPQFEAFIRDVFQKSDYPAGLFFVDTARLAQRTYSALAPMVMMAGGSLFSEKTKEFFRKNPLPREISFAETLGQWTVLKEVDEGRRAISAKSQSPVGMAFVPLIYGLGAGLVIYAVPYLDETFLSLADNFHAAVFGLSSTTASTSAETSENSSLSSAPEIPSSLGNEVSADSTSEPLSEAPQVEASQDENKREENPLE